jgi:hypothetical protein
VGELQAVCFRRGIEFDASIEGEEVHGFKGSLDLFGIDRIRIFDGLLQDQAGCISASDMIGGLLPGRSFIGGYKVRAARPVPLFAEGLSFFLCMGGFRLPLTRSLYA